MFNYNSLLSSIYSVCHHISVHLDVPSHARCSIIVSYYLLSIQSLTIISVDLSVPDYGVQSSFAIIYSISTWRTKEAVKNFIRSISLKFIDLPGQSFYIECSLLCLKDCTCSIFFNLMTYPESDMECSYEMLFFFFLLRA